MTEPSRNPPVDLALLGGEFYVTGGTLRPDAPSYVERRADRELSESLLRGEFCYVLTSRQMGKSSLMVRTVRRLRQEGVAVAVLDLTAIGQNVTLGQWYDGLISRLGQQLNLEDELQSFSAAHPEWGPLQRWVTGVEQVVLERFSGKVVIFIDEIDIVRSLPFPTDEFFAAIRECYNRRSREPAFSRLAFGLLGVAAPSDLIRDTRMTPFNIGRRIELNDFTEQEAAPLARGLCADDRAASALLARVLYWTGGHPYLTQRLCRALADTVFQPPTASTGPPPLAPPVLPRIGTVDQMADKLFLSRQARDRDDNLIFVRERILRSEGDVAGLLYLYRRIHSGQLVPDDETNPLVSVLRLSGITQGINGFLQIRNQIYSRVFDLQWVQTNMPKAEVRRQRRAAHKGMVVGFGIALMMLLAYLVFGPIWKGYRNTRLASGIVQGLDSTYRQSQGYQDTFETTVEIGLGGTPVPVEGSGSLLFHGSNEVDLVLKTSFSLPETELRLLHDGKRGLLFAPALNQYQALEAVPGTTTFDLPASVAEAVGPFRILPLYRILLAPSRQGLFLPAAQNIRFGGLAEVDGEPVRIVHWDHEAGGLLGSLGMTNPRSGDSHFPVTAWVNLSGRVVQFRVNVSAWAQDLTGAPSDIPITGLSITEKHKSIVMAAKGSFSNRFLAEVPASFKQVTSLDLPPANLAALTASRRQFAKLIPARLSLTSSNQIDLTDYYNAALVQTWHPGLPTNSLDALPTGLLQLAGGVFDVRGIVQLSGRQLRNAGGRFPEQITGIGIGQLCRRLLILHAAGWRSGDGVRIGSYCVHYADGAEERIPIIYGEDVRDWSTRSDPVPKLKRSSLAWTGVNSAGLPVRLFRTVWTNPRPETEITSIDYLSTMADSAPFLIAITTEE